MHSVVRILVSGFIGAVVCALCGFLMYLMLTLFDNTRLDEAIFYSLIVAFLSAFIGVIIGLVIGIGDLGVIGGGIVGFLLTLCVVLFYVLSSADPGEYGYFFRASRIIFVVLTVPTILTGISTAFLKNLFYKRSPRPLARASSSGSP